MNVLITGADGFIGKNLKVRLTEDKAFNVLTFTRADSKHELTDKLAQCDFIFHLAGVNRPKDEQEFKTGNQELTLALCECLKNLNKQVPIVYSSSTQANNESPYGKSKCAAEEILSKFAKQNNSTALIYRLPNVFGKWAKPNYNSAVATFCYNIAHDLPIQIHDEAALINLVYVDNVVEHFISLLKLQHPQGANFQQIEPIYPISVGELVAQIKRFHDSRNSLITEEVGNGLTRALYSTYISYLEPADFAYPVAQHSDPRGTFVEMVKTKNAGQFSYFTAHPGITRGGHYHHSKTEKFLVIKGQAHFRFRHISTQETHEIFTSGDQPQIVETVPGWSHDITNCGSDELIVMLWANEIFDRNKPDTYGCPV
jgi:UDP-2-acetamido-2,6-beta-L-arabino-hexul-4-ose reductase